MSKFNPEQQRIETASALDRVVNTGRQERHAAYVGLDVHKETIAVAVAEAGRAEPVYRGEITNKPKMIEKLLTKLEEDYDGGLLQFCYEAGPCGYVHRSQHQPVDMWTSPRDADRPKHRRVDNP